MNQLELAYQDTIIDAAGWHGWLAHGERPARTKDGWRTPIVGQAGWPDLVLCHDKHRIFVVAELKVPPNDVTALQRTWIDSLRSAGVTARVWRLPDKLPAILAWLADPITLEVP